MRYIHDVHYHIERITKKYILDFLNALFFANSILWDSDDQFNMLPVLKASEDTSDHVEQRGALIVHKSAPKCLRCFIVACKRSHQEVCYRITNIVAPIRVDEKKSMYYPLEGVTLDLSIADLNLGVHDLTSYSFYDNAEQSGKVSTKKLFSLLTFLTGSHYISINKPDIFEDLIDNLSCFPPATCDPHYQPIFGVKPNEPHYWY